MKDFIHSHKFSDLHDGESIIYSRGTVSGILSSLSIISRMNRPVILITANEDTTIDERWDEYIPNNLYCWFAQNGISNNPKVILIPEGLQPSYGSKTGDIGYDIGHTKEVILNGLIEKKPTKFIYSNFNIGTNPPHRNEIKEICENTNYIDWENNVNFNTYEDYNNYDVIKYFYEKIQDYRAVVCPLGHGLDTHRVYETLYCGRIPITFHEKLYSKLYEKYPIVYLDNCEKLRDESYIDSLIKKEEEKVWDQKLLNFSYWGNLILSEKHKMLKY
jgi:hypothetical protein